MCLRGSEDATCMQYKFHVEESLREVLIHVLVFAFFDGGNGLEKVCCDF